ncbi:MAG: hypothetical protein HC810_02540 [Acaryochloridaceae cyanobacterium RL_2_7]|nr:hypothetical protein [Acaryochloridaceae cyanobacterium RL_2_7]
MFLNRKSSVWVTTAIAGLAAVAMNSVPLAAQAKDGDVIQRVSCSQRSEIKLKASPENGRIEVEAEIDDSVPGQRWRLVMKKNSQTIFNGVRQVNSLGNVEVRVLTPNGAGVENIVANARNLNTGEQCNVSVRYSG